MATSITSTNALKGADKSFGYAFGCEGLVSTEEAMQILAVSRYTLDRRVADHSLRKGRHPGGGRVAFCRRSIREYLARMEL